MSQLKKSMEALDSIDTRGETGGIMTVKRINAMQEAIKSLARGENLSLGRGFTTHRTNYLTQIDYVGHSGRRGVTEEVMHPYKAIVEEDYGSTAENPRYVWGVYYDSQILTGPAPMEFIEPGKYKNRLPKDTSGDGSFWFNVISTDALYVEYDCEERTAEIKSWGNGGSADAWNLQRPIKIDLEDDNAPQTKSYYLIAYTLPDNAGKPRFYQCLHTHLQLGTWCYGTRAAILLMPYDGGGYAATKDEDYKDAKK